MKQRTLFRGVLAIALLAAISYALASIPVISALGISSLVLAIVLGIVVGNSWHHPASWTPGIQFSAKRLLRLAIILYGFRVSFQQIASVGIDALLIDIIIVAATLFVGYIIGRKLLKLDRDMALLISMGSAICGAAAVLAAEDILKSEPYKTAVAVGTVVLFGTTSMFLYPFLQHSGWLHLTTFQYGIFTGSSIHEVAQAVVAGNSVSSDAGAIAVIVKMIRVLLLVPVLLLLALFISRATQGEHKKKVKITVPWFAIGFLIVIGFNSLHLLSATWINIINQTDTVLLTMAMGAIGVETKLSKLKKVGLKPLYLSIFLFVWLITSALVMVQFV